MPNSPRVADDADDLDGFPPRDTRVSGRQHAAAGAGEVFVDDRDVLVAGLEEPAGDSDESP
jgi:hypothetical protein